MEIIFIAIECFILFGIYEAVSETYGCGPRNKCECFTDKRSSVMDCEGKHISKIAEICSVLGNNTMETRVTLRAGRNNFGNFNATELEGCEHLNELNVHFNQISEFRKDTFINFTNLKVLDLSRNNLMVFKSGWSSEFMPLSITTLILNGCPVDTAAIRNYPKLSHLRKLQMLRIDGLRDNFDIGKHTNMLQELSLSGLYSYSHCSIPHISNWTFKQLVSVVKLNISACNVRSISAGAFEHLKHLQILDLSYNRKLGFRSMENISYGLQFTDIRSVYMSYIHTTFGLGTSLLKQDLCYIWNTSIEEMFIAGNRLMSFETNALILLPDSLTTMDVSDNGLVFLPYLLQTSCMKNVRKMFGALQHSSHYPSRYIVEDTDDGRQGCEERAFSSCPYMQEAFLMKIAANKWPCNYIQPNLRNISLETDLPKHLEFVDFHESNLIYKVQINFNITPHENALKHIDLSNNVFNIFTGEYGPFPNIEVINVSRCYMVQIGEKSLNYPSLKILRLDNNYLGDQLADSMRSNIFECLTSLKCLNLSSNGITILHRSTFAPLTNLTDLDLSCNNIGNLDIMLPSLTNLLHIDLHVNSLHALARNMRAGIELNARKLNSTFEIDLRNNSLDYSCENQDFLNWLYEHQSNMKTFELYVFRLSDGRIMGATWFQKEISHLEGTCRSYTLLIVLCCIGISSALATVVGGVIYRHRWKLRYLLFMSRKRFFGYRRLPDYTLIENYRFDAFISYAEDHFRFILDEVIPRLEAENVSLCLHQRDFLPGNAISDNIIHAIQSSRKTIVILSEAFLRSKWCMYEFNMARMESMYSREDQVCLVIVMLEPVPHNKMPLEMLRWVQENSYIEYTHEPDGNRMFWENIVLAIK